MARPDVGAGRPVFPRVDDGARPAGDDQILYRVGERAIRLSDLGVFLLSYFPDRAGDALTQLLDEALAAAEAEREGVTVADASIAARTDAYLEERRKQARLEYGADVELETVLQRRYGRSLEQYRRDAARLARTQLLIDRLVILDRRRVDRVEFRVLVFDKLDAATSAVERLRAGADMTLLARSSGLRPPVSPPAFARGEIDAEDLAAKLFAAAPGDYIDPVAFQTPDAPGRTFHQVFRVVRVLAGTEAPWSELRDDIERELEGKGRTGPRSYLRWKRRVLARLNVDVRDAARGFVPWTHGGGLPESSERVEER